MENIFDRRQLLLAGVAGSLVMLPGCSSLGGFSMTEAIRRILSLSSQKAFAMLLQPGGFYDSSVARLALPDRFGGLGGSGILSTILQSQSFRERLQRQLNRSAEKGAERAAPLVADAIKSIGIESAAAIVRGGPQAATTFLQGKMGTALLDAMLPGIGDGLRLFDDQVIGQALKSVTGFDFSALANDITAKANSSIWAAIGAEEAKIRDDPQSTNDPILIAVFGLGKRL
jgi:hypothetical protein